MVLARIAMKKPALHENAERVRTIGPNTTISGRPMQTCYGPADVAEQDYASRVADPGQFPFTRGVHPDMYRGKLWTMRQYAGFGTAEQTNARFRHLLAAGQTDRK